MAVEYRCHFSFKKCLSHRLWEGGQWSVSPNLPCSYSFPYAPVPAVGDKKPGRRSQSLEQKLLEFISCRAVRAAAW